LNIVKNSAGGILTAIPFSHASRPLVHLRIPCFSFAAHRRVLLEFGEPDLGQEKRDVPWRSWGAIDTQPNPTGRQRRIASGGISF
jgi:hypothetical protein